MKRAKADVFQSVMTPAQHSLLGCISAQKEKDQENDQNTQYL